MTMSSELRARWPWPRLGLLAVVALAMWALKRHYATASVDELSWILTPVAELSTWMSGTSFEWEPGSGYLSRERLFVIAKPCAGVNFMMAALATIAYLLSMRAVTWRASAYLFASSLAMAYAWAAIANSARIAAALWLAAHPLKSDFWSPSRVHRLEGIVVYFGMLLLLQLILQRLTTASAATYAAVAEGFRRARVPLASYYLVTVLIPIANGSADMSRAFLEHMAFVMLAPPTFVGLLAIARRAWLLAPVSRQFR